MKLKPDRATISKLVAAVLFSGLLIWNIGVIKRQITLSKLHIVRKDLCGYSPEKSVTIFLDARAQRSLRRFHVTPTKIVNEANAVFAEHGLPIRYNLKNLKLRTWSSEKKDCIFREDFPDKVRCFLNELRPRYRAERKDNDPDVVIFMTATGISDVSGMAYYSENHDGNGTIVLNIGVDLKSYDSDRRLSEVARKFFLRRFAHLVTHEQTHLYGLDHSSDKRSIMWTYSNSFGDSKIRFDKKTLHDLTKREAELNKIRSKCAAQK